MNTDPDFAKNLFEKLVNLTKKNAKITNETPAASKSESVISTASSAPNGTEGKGNTSVSGTPQVVDTKPTKELNQSESGKNTPSTSSKKTDRLNNKSTSLLEKVKEKKVAEKEKQTQDTVQTGEIDTEQEKSESAQETKQTQQQQVGDDWYKSPLADFKERARELAVEKAAQMQQAHYVVAEPRPPVSIITREKTIPVQIVI